MAKPGLFRFTPIFFAISFGLAPSIKGQKNFISPLYNWNCKKIGKGKTLQFRQGEYLYQRSLWTVYKKGKPYLVVMNYDPAGKRLDSALYQAGKLVETYSFSLASAETNQGKITQDIVLDRGRKLGVHRTVIVFALKKGQLKKIDTEEYLKDTIVYWKSIPRHCIVLKTTSEATYTSKDEEPGYDKAVALAIVYKAPGIGDIFYRTKILNPNREYQTELVSIRDR